MSPETRSRIELFGFIVSLLMVLAGVLIFAMSVCATSEREGDLIAIVGLAAIIPGMIGVNRSMRF